MKRLRTRICLDEKEEENNKMHKSEKPPTSGSGLIINGRPLQQIMGMGIFRNVKDVLMGI